MEGERGEGGEGRGTQSLRWFQPITLIVCVGLEVPCKPAEGLFLLHPCVCPLSPPPGGPPSCPPHAGPSRCVQLCCEEVPSGDERVPVNNDVTSAC